MSKELYKKYVERMNSMESVRALFAKPHLVRRAALVVLFDRKEAERRVIAIANLRAAK